jgi:hypothetical protein
MEASLVSVPVTACLKYMRFIDHINLNFNNNMPTAAVFLDIEKAFDTTWHLGLLYKLWESKFLIILIKLITCFLSHRKFRVSIEEEKSTPRYIKTGVPRSPILSPTLYSAYIYIYIYTVYISDTPQTPGDRKESYVLRKLLQRDLSATEMWCERWNTKISEDKTQAIYFSHRLMPPQAHPTLNGRNIFFFSHVKYIGVISDKRVTWRLDIEMIEANVFRTCIRIYSLFKSKR